MIWLLVLIASPLGAVALFLGLRGRRVDAHPLCRKCGFDLIGTPEPRGACPECGADVSSRVRVGNRKRSVAAVVGGLAMLLVALGVGGVGGYSAYMRAQDYGLQPTWWLMYTTRGHESFWGGAMDELMKRQLSDAQKAELDRRALGLQGDPARAWEPRWGYWIERRRDEGGLTAADWECYTQQWLLVGWQLPENSKAGEPIRIAVTTDARLGTGYLSWEQIEPVVVEIDGDARPSFRFATPSGHGYQGLYTWYVVVPQDDTAAALAPGTHRCRVKIPLRIRRHERKAEAVRHDRAYELEGTIEIVAGDAR